MRRKGFEEARDPILNPLDTIECSDAILTPDSTEPKWPAAFGDINGALRRRSVLAAAETGRPSITTGRIWRSTRVPKP